MLRALLQVPISGSRSEGGTEALGGLILAAADHPPAEDQYYKDNR